jgi:phosphatidylserine/phosphatidylglycerophosphate/cardiolipin synthase-like enzyme
MHHKVIILDGSIVITGSYNFSASAAEKNDENVLIIHSPEIAATYLEEFERVVQQAEEAD